MNLFVFSDESGVFDKIHNDKFVFGWLLFLSKKDKDNHHRKYINVERTMRVNNPVYSGKGLKACIINNKHKNKLFRSLNQIEKGAVILNQKKILDSIYKSKKDKQRYLDYAYKIGVKRHLESLINEGQINPNDVKNIYFVVDEHTTATNGIYELKESLEQEFKRGTYNFKWDTFYPPLFPNLNCVEVKFGKSDKIPLIRASDIVANKVYHHSINDTLDRIANKVHICKLP